MFFGALALASVNNLNHAQKPQQSVEPVLAALACAETVSQLCGSLGREGNAMAIRLRIPTKPAMHSNLNPATDSELKPASVPI
ncbi:hypothetical protein [Acidocella facilis]|uniref:hypothetical protein n=1 Tax=Acidocella facilis TaxID=525 RepID=UPI0004790162|nr:hypothetical protein [Acidocella facilis]